jgi:hypothetical protein
VVVFVAHSADEVGRMWIAHGHWKIQRKQKERKEKKRKK